MDVLQKLDVEEIDLVLDIYRANTQEGLSFEASFGRWGAQLRRLVALGLVEQLAWEQSQHWPEYQLTIEGLLEANNIISSKIEMLQRQVAELESLLAE